MIVNEEIADFRKSAQIKDKDYLSSQRAFLSANNQQKSQTFLNYCFAVIHQQNKGHLSIRESAYAISTYGEKAAGLSNSVKLIVSEALSLRRHPSNYKEDHQLGW